MTRRRDQLPFEIDPVTRKIRKGSITVDGQRVVMTLPRNLKSPNKTTGTHWIRKHGNTQQWELLIKLTIGDHIGATTVSGYSAPVEALGLSRPTGRVRVTVERLVPTRRDLIKDDDNLRFTPKPLNDALKRLGFLIDDKREWLEQPMPTQRVAPGGLHWTVITIEPAESYETVGGFDVIADKILKRAGVVT